MGAVGWIPGTTQFIAGLYAISRAINPKPSPYVVVFSERVAFLKEAEDCLNKVNERIDELSGKEKLTSKELTELHKLQTEKERLQHEIKANKDYDKKEIARINKDLEEWVGPGSKYIDDRPTEIPDSNSDDKDD